MKTVILYVDGLLSVCDGLGVEKRLKRHRGIRRVEASFLSGTATVEYDEGQVSLDEVVRMIHECGYGCSGECHPEHLCRPIGLGGA